ncbi:efflux pump antibiotic resistance protein, putative [Talaromyces stipitatus ATCC 10500]|uniref:Efflux pump antibiotic resistance protein, putative n=1 Tax=Talaromyces stipitatus (strain ATCC 10500 / CBS 375.48 / QM 6759 / NRRL 1006) TaxID=441959 RepID=B8MEY4_TALSN|nr:efflux pump antibiotic resistance protein, putative [Talaromyces stipitatus ATCC 10500]EED17267.1 efflux pump antibiotic resistance protein, putative [Talaromyces stipitatus ATCC 10500]
MPSTNSRSDQGKQKEQPGDAVFPADQTPAGNKKPNFPKSWRFYAILTTLSVTGLLTTIEGTIITNALPTITAALGGGSSSLWIADAYFLASVATLPLYAQMSNIFGRRSMLLASVAIFVLGSGLSGGSSSMAMLIASRTIQGLGGGGISLLIETVVQDLVPLRERGKYMSVVLMFSTLGAALGPLLGGLIASKTTWRWVFYINVPVGGAALVALYFFLRLNYRRDQTWKQRVSRIDFVGNMIFIAAMAAMILALTWGGTVYSWSSYRILVALILGFIGLFIWTGFEWTPKFAPEPSFPRKIVSNRTSSAALILTFLHSTITYWSFYFLPIYFQAVKNRSPLASGVDTLPTFAGIIPFAIMGGVLLSKTGRYKPLHFVGFIPMSIGFGLFSTLDENSSDAAWVCYQLLCSVGAGMLAGILLPAVQAPLDESDVATATGLWSFVRGFGAIWGVTIPAAVFNNEASKYAVMVSDAAVAQKLSGGKAYESATQEFLNTISDPAVKAEVIRVFARSMQTVWYVCLAFSLPGLIITLFEKEVTLRQDLQTEFGIEDKKDPAAFGMELPGVEADAVRSPA